MCDYITTGGIFTPDRVPGFHVEESNFSLVRVTRFPHGKGFVYAVQDGHHRLVSMALAGRKHLDPREYLIQDFASGDLFGEINFDVGWVTPFDIHTELRHPDVYKFKEKVLNMPVDEATKYIWSHRDEYCMPRNGLHTVYDLSRCVSSGDCVIQ